MGFLNNNQQEEVSLQRRLPVSTSTSEQKASYSGTVAFYYWNSGVYTVDAGEAAGTLIAVPLAHRNIKGALGDVLASTNDTSLAWTTGTTLTTLREFNYLVAEESERNGLTAEEKAIALTTGFTDGEYCLDAENGVAYGIKADAGTSDTATYNILSGSSSTAQGTYNLTPPTLSDGETDSLQLDTSANLKTTMATGLNVTDDAVSIQPVEPSNINTSAYAASLVIKGAPGTLYKVRGYNSGAAQFIQLHDAATLPANGAVPEDIIAVAATSNFEFTFPQSKAFTTGIVVCNSSTAATKTIGGADCWFSAEYL